MRKIVFYIFFLCTSRSSNGKCFIFKVFKSLLLSFDFRFNGFKMSFSSILIKELTIRVTLYYRMYRLLQLMMKVLYFFKQIRCKNLQLLIEPAVLFIAYPRPLFLHFSRLPLQMIINFQKYFSLKMKIFVKLSEFFYMSLPFFSLVLFTMNPQTSCLKILFHFFSSFLFFPFRLPVFGICDTFFL